MLVSSISNEFHIFMPYTERGMALTVKVTQRLTNVSQNVIVY